MAVLNTVIDGYTPRREAYGTVSGNIYFRLPAILRRAYSHPYDVYAVENVEARRYALMRYALDKACSLALTGNPMGLVTAFDFADKHSETLIRDIHDGTLSPDFPLPDALHAAALNQLPPNPRRARALAAARAKAGRLQPTDYWPGFSLAGCWIGGSMGHFTPRLRDWCGEGLPFRDAGYMASEGIFTVPQANNSVDGLPALHAVFFEFLAEHDFGKPDAPALLAHELEPGRNYHVVVTTTGGLYRYAMNDVVRAAERQQETPLLRFLYKGGHVQNMQGEMVSIEHVMTTMAALAVETGVRLRHFQIIAEIDRRRYALHIEPSEALGPGPAAPAAHRLRPGAGGGERELHHLPHRPDAEPAPPRRHAERLAGAHHRRPPGPQRPRFPVQARRAGQRTGASRDGRAVARLVRRRARRAAGGGGIAERRVRRKQASLALHAAMRPASPAPSTVMVGEGRPSTSLQARGCAIEHPARSPSQECTTEARRSLRRSNLRDLRASVVNLVLTLRATAMIGLCNEIPDPRRANSWMVGLRGP